jgi:hypothetical protein
VNSKNFKNYRFALVLILIVLGYAKKRYHEYSAGSGQTFDNSQGLTPIQEVFSIIGWFVLIAFLLEMGWLNKQD